MSHPAEQYRQANREKAQRLTRPDPVEKVDASDWTPPELLNAGAKTGLRPVSQRQFKRGGKVEGSQVVRADRKPRKSGGRALTADALINRDVREANEKRPGVKHVGGFKSGGNVEGSAKDRAEDKKMAKKHGVSMAEWEGSAADKKQDAALAREARKSGGCVSDGEIQGTRPTGGRLARKDGGRAKGKGKVDVNIYINPKAGPQDMPPGLSGMPMPPPGAAGPAPQALPQPMPPPPGPPGVGGPPPMPRKAGGRVYRSYKDMDAGAMSGLGRLEKTEIQARKS